jgi:SAM-dependent methyltransferase
MDQALKSKAEKYYDNFIERLATDYVQSNPRIERAIQFSLKWLKATSANRVLDIGCGIGWSTAEFSTHLEGSQIDGMDLSPKLIETAKSLFAQSNSARFSVTDITSPQFQPKEKYDALVMLDLYEHIPVADRKGFHQAIKNCLGEKFVVVLTCPSPGFQDFLRKNQPELMQPVDEDVTEEDAKTLAEDIGGRLITFQPTSVWQSNDYNHMAIVNSAINPGDLQQMPFVLEKRDSKIKRISKTPLKPILKKLGKSTWLKAQYPFLIHLYGLLKGN